MSIQIDFDESKSLQKRSDLVLIFRSDQEKEVEMSLDMKTTQKTLLDWCAGVALLSVELKNSHALLGLEISTLKTNFHDFRNDFREDLRRRDASFAAMDQKIDM